MTSARKGAKRPDASAGDMITGIKGHARGEMRE